MPKWQPGDRGALTGRQHKLTDKQRAFIKEYARGLNGTRAALAAGVPERSAAGMAVEWLDEQKYPLVAEALKEEVERRRKRREVSAQKVTDELACIAFFSPRDLFSEDGSIKALTELPDDVWACVKSIKVSYAESPDGDGNFVRLKTYDVRFHDKLEAIKQLASHMGLIRSGASLNVTQNTLQLGGEQLTDEQRARALSALLARYSGCLPGPHTDGNGNAGGPTLGGTGTGPYPGIHDSGPLATNGTGQQLAPDDPPL